MRVFKFLTKEPLSAFQANYIGSAEYGFQSIAQPIPRVAFFICIVIEQIHPVNFAADDMVLAIYHAVLVFSGIIVAPRWAAASCLRHHPDGFVTAIWRKAGQVAASQPESQPESIEFRVLRLLQSLGYDTPDQAYRTANLKDFF